MSKATICPCCDQEIPPAATVCPHCGWTDKSRKKTIDYLLIAAYVVAANGGTCAAEYALYNTENEARPGESLAFAMVGAFYFGIVVLIAGWIGASSFSTFKKIRRELASESQPPAPHDARLKILNNQKSTYMAIAVLGIIASLSMVAIALTMSNPNPLVLTILIYFVGAGLSIQAYREINQ